MRLRHSHALPFSLLLITDEAAAASAGRSVVETVEAALGAHAENVAVMLRCKDRAPSEVLQQARALKQITDRTGARLIVHTFPEVADAVGAYGVHVADGVPRTPSYRGRWGASRHLDTLQRGNDDALAWVTLSPVFPPTSKPDDTRPPLGLHRLRTCCAASSVPVIALGGVTPNNILSCAVAGADVLLMPPDPLAVRAA
ncbi:MAG: thiamine phosphate synthase, partial [Myxococcota bacterium]